MCCREDGNCLYRAFAHMIYKNQNEHHRTRKESVEQMEKFKEFFQGFFWRGWDYIIRRKKRSDGTEWGDHVDIIAMSKIYNIRVNVYEYNQKFKKIETVLEQNKELKDLPIPNSFGTM